MTTKRKMGQTKELVRAYAPLIAAVIIIGLLRGGIAGWGLNLSLFLLVGTEVALMTRQRQGKRDSDLVEALMKGPPKRTRDTALALAHVPRIGVELIARLTMPRSGNLALTVLFVALFITNMTTLLNGGEIVTGEVEPAAEIDTN